MIKVKFKQWNCELKKGYYEQGRIALYLEGIGEEQGEPIATCTVNLPNDFLPPGHVHIKEWSENNGMTQALVEAGVIETTGIEIKVGPYGSFANLCKILKTE